MRRARLAVLAVSACLLSSALGAQTVPTLADLTVAAQSGDSAAQTALAMRHLEGRGTLQNHVIAATWFAEAAEAGDAEAQNALGKLYYTGLGVERDPETAVRWLDAAAASGVPDYLYDLAVVLETDATVADLARAVTLYTRAAQDGYIPATVSLGVLYQNGTGVDQDYARAKALYEAGVAAGSAQAQNNLGLLYVRGNGVAQDYARAATLFQAATDQGLRTAMSNLAVLYANGFGVPLDEALSIELFRRAGSGERAEPARMAQFTYDPRLAPPPRDAEGLARLDAAARADDPVALFQLGWLLATDAQADFAAMTRAHDHFKRAAERGYGPAMASLSWMYFEGLGGPQDYVLGHMWMLMAKRAGVQTQALDITHAQTATPDQVNAAQVRAGDMLEAAGQVIRP